MAALGCRCLPELLQGIGCPVTLGDEHPPPEIEPHRLRPVLILPIDVMAGLPTAMFAAVMAGLSLGNAWYVKRLSRRSHVV